MANAQIISLEIAVFLSAVATIIGLAVVWRQVRLLETKSDVQRLKKLLLAMTVSGMLSQFPTITTQVLKICGKSTEFIEMTARIAGRISYLSFILCLFTIYYLYEKEK